MRFYKEIQVKERSLDSVRCDMCWKTFSSLNWGGGAYDINDTSVCMTTGKDYVDDIYINEEIVFDICPTCFKNGLVPFIKSKFTGDKSED